MDEELAPNGWLFSNHYAISKVRVNLLMSGCLCAVGEYVVSAETQLELEHDPRDFSRTVFLEDTKVRLKRGSAPSGRLGIYPNDELVINTNAVQQGRALMDNEGWPQRPGQKVTYSTYESGFVHAVVMS